MTLEVIGSHMFPIITDDHAKIKCAYFVTYWTTDYKVYSSQAGGQSSKVRLGERGVTGSYDNPEICNKIISQN
jgi:hypothetical protein